MLESERIFTKLHHILYAVQFGVVCFKMKRSTVVLKAPKAKYASDVPVNLY